MTEPGELNKPLLQAADDAPSPRDTARRLETTARRPGMRPIGASRRIVVQGYRPSSRDDKPPSVDATCRLSTMRRISERRFAVRRRRAVASGYEPSSAGDGLYPWTAVRRRRRQTVVAGEDS